LAQLQTWIQEAKDAGSRWAEVMSLATCDLDGRPSVRAVVMRGLDHSGLAFDTDHRSRKAAELRANPWAAVAFLWPELRRQVRIEGRVEPEAAEESDRRYRSVPREQRLAIRASLQSDVITGREQLEYSLSEVAQSFAGADVPRPSYWGGYRLDAGTVELWQERADRLHDRLRYRLLDDGAWAVERLAP